MIAKPQHFGWSVDGGVATITLNRPERKNPLTFDSYAELTSTFRALGSEAGVRAVVLTGAGGNFCSGGDVREIIGPLVETQRALQEAGTTVLARISLLTGLRPMHFDSVGQLAPALYQL